MSGDGAGGDTCRIEMVDGEPVRVRGSGDWTAKDHDMFAEVVRAARRLMEHPHDEWSGMCRCGAGPFTRPEHRAHLRATPAAPATPAQAAGGEGL